MEPVDFDEANTFMKPPEGMTEEQCAAMPVFRNEQWCISCWELSGEDLMTILQTKRVWLMVMGGQPPLAVTAEKPFEKEGDAADEGQAPEGDQAR